jgi:hypothetical protein
MEVSGVSILCDLFSDGTMQVTGILNKLSAQDLTDPIKEEEIISIQEGEDLIQFSYRTFPPSSSLGLGSEVSVHTNSVRFIYKDKFVKGLQKYFTEITEMQQLVQSTTSFASDAISNMYASKDVTSTGGMKFQISVVNPQIKFPRYFVMFWLY